MSFETQCLLYYSIYYTIGKCVIPRVFGKVIIKGVSPIIVCQLWALERINVLILN